MKKFLLDPKLYTFMWQHVHTFNGWRDQPPGGAAEVVLQPMVVVPTISTSMPNLVLVSKSAQTLHIWELSHWTKSGAVGYNVIGVYRWILPKF